MNLENPEFVDHFLKPITTPLALPPNYVWTKFQAGKIIYKNSDQETLISDPYLHHSKNLIIVDEFRKNFPHDAILVILADNRGNLILQLRGFTMRWEPNKLDLASVVGQVRARLVKNRFEKTNAREQALHKIAEETGVQPKKINPDLLVKIGEHLNPRTQEHQTIYYYPLEVTIYELNHNLTLMNGDKAQAWVKQPYKQTLDQYFGDQVEKYAGGAAIREINYITDPKIRAKLEKLLI